MSAPDPNVDRMPPQITREEWLAKPDDNCPCDNHPAEACETCRGACGCHFVETYER